MSRTHRKNSEGYGWFKKNYRSPKTYREKRQLDSLCQQEEFTPRNRDKSRINNLPTTWDDIRKSASYEYEVKHGL